MAAGTNLLGELHYRLEEIDVEPQCVVELVEQLELLRCVIAVIGDGATNNGVVLLFHKAVVILAVRPRACETDLLGITVAH